MLHDSAARCKPHLSAYVAYASSSQHSVPVHHRTSLAFFTSTRIHQPRHPFDMSQQLYQKLTSDEIAPHVVPSIPTDIQPLNVTYVNTKEVTPGMELTPTEVKHAPSKVSWQVQDSNALYTVLMMDPDAPSRRRPRMRCLVHWMVVNVRGGDISTGDVGAPYLGAGPPQGSGLHRYVLLAYKQSSKVDPSKLPGFRFMQRGGYSPDAVIKTLQKAGSGELKLEAANYYVSQYDDYVPQYYQEQLGIFAVPMGMMMKLMML